MESLSDLPNLNGELAEVIHRVASTDAARFDAVRGRPVLEAKLAERERSRGLRGAGRGAPAGRTGGTYRVGVSATHAARLTVWYAVAALLVSSAGVVAGWWARGAGARVHRKIQTAVSTYATAAGQRATITLSDGSTVALNVASRLEVPVDYAAGNRTLRLSGEALFTVTHHDGAPFTVVAGTTAARVLGTSFAVRHYPTDSTATVAVREGKVAVHSTVLTAGQEIETGPGETARLGRAGAGRFTFVTGVLTLDSLALPAAVIELNRWYDADIRIGDAALAGRRITGKFAAGSLADLTSILELMDVRVIRNGRVLTLHSRQS